MKMIWLWLFLILGTLLIGGVAIVSKNQPLLEEGFAEIRTFLFAEKEEPIEQISSKSITINPFKTNYLPEYKIRCTGNESYLCPYIKYKLIYVKGKWNKTRFNISSPKERFNTSYTDVEGKYIIQDDYILPDTFPLKEKEGITPISKELKKANILSPTPDKFEEGDKIEYIFELDANVGYAELGEFTITIIQANQVVTDALLLNMTAEGNCTHINISNDTPYEGLVGYWNFGCDPLNSKLTNHYDYSKYNNDGTGIADALVKNSSDGLYGNYLVLDGTGDYVDMGDKTIFEFVLNFTVSTWVKTTDASDMEIVSKAAAGGNFEFVFAKVSTDEIMFIKTRCGGSTVATCTTSGESINDGNWHHVVGVMNSSRLDAFVDGSLACTDTTFASDPCTGAEAPLTIGRGSGGRNNWNGEIDEIMVFNTTLTATQISDIYNNQSARYVDTAKLTLENQTYLNITTDNNWMNLTIECETDLGSNIGASLGYYDTSWHFTPAQNLTRLNTTHCRGNFSVGTSTKLNWTINFTHYAGDYNFNAPIQKGIIEMENWSTITADVSAPTYSNFQDNSSATQPTNSTDVQLNVTISDGTAVDFYRIATNNTDGNSLTNQTLINATNPTSLTAIFNESLAWFPQDIDSILGWQVWANDTGGFSSVSAMQTVTIRAVTVADTDNPDYNGFQNNASTVTKINGVVNWSINISDETNLSGYIFAHNNTGTLSNGSFNLINDITANVSQLVTITQPQGNSVCGQFWFNDSSGNINQTNITESGACFVVINTAPIQPSISFPINSKNYSDIPYINYSSGDDDGDSLTYDIYINGSLNTSLVDTNLTDWNASDGFYNLTVTAFDGVDYTINSTVVHFRLDTVVPAFSNQVKNETPNVNEFLRLNITIDDINPDSYKFFWNDSGALTNDTSSTYTSGVVSTTKQTKTPHQNICWGYWANDTAGNSASSSLDCFTVTNSIPTVPVITSPYDNEINNTRKIIYTSSDLDNDSLTYSIYINGTLNITTNVNVTVWNGSDGAYNLSVTSIDGIDTSANSTVVNFILDTTPPTVTLIAPINNSNITSNSIDFNYSATDSIAVNNCSLFIDNSFNRSFTNNNNFTSTTIENGNYSWFVNCSDSVPNWGFSGIFNLTVTANKSSSIDLLFANATLIYKTLFGEGENLRYYINWTDASKLPLNDTVGECNITLIDALTEVESVQDDFTMCSTGCDFLVYNESFTFDSTVNVTRDIGHAFVCNEQLQQQDAIVNISCTSGSYQEIRDGATIPLCDDGPADVRVNTSVCINDLVVNISVSYDGIFQRRKRVIDLAIDREFSSHTMSSEEGEIIFNQSLQLWQTKHIHEYYDHGLKNITANCTHNDPRTSNSIFEQLTVVNAPPRIFFSEVTTNLGMTELTGTISIVNTSGIWNWSTAVVDDDLALVNYTFYNSSKDVLQSNQSTIPLEIKTPDGMFSHFENPYNFTIWATDTANERTEESILFDVTTGIITVFALRIEDFGIEWIGLNFTTS